MNDEQERSEKQKKSKRKRVDGTPEHSASLGSEDSSSSMQTDDSSALSPSPSPVPSAAPSEAKKLRMHVMKARENRPSAVPKLKHGGDAKGRSDAFDISSEFGTVGRRDVDQAKKLKWEFITLRLRQVPLQPHSHKTNIFGDHSPRAKWDHAIQAIKQNAIGYFQAQLAGDELADDIIDAASTNLGNNIAIALDQIEEDEPEVASDDESAATPEKTLTDEIEDALKFADSKAEGEMGKGKYKPSEKLITKLIAKEKNFVERFGQDSKEVKSIHLLMTYLKIPGHASNWKLNEWLHTIADSLGGPVADWNGASGSYASNTQMAAIENLIKHKPGIGVQVTAYSQPEKRIAEWYEYTIIAHDDKGNPVRKITFEIDAQRTHYGIASLTRDQQIVLEFLRETAAVRKADDEKRSRPIPEFTLPEVVSISEGNKKAMKLEPGPLYGQVKANPKELTRYGNKNEKLVLKSVADQRKYESYVELAREHEGNKKVYEAQLAVIKPDTPELLAVQYEKDHAKKVDKPPHLMRYDSFSEQLASVDGDGDLDMTSSASVNPDLSLAKGKPNAAVASFNSGVGRSKSFALPPLKPVGPCPTLDGDGVSTKPLTSPSDKPDSAKNKPGVSNPLSCIGPDSVMKDASKQNPRGSRR